MFLRMGWMFSSLPWFKHILEAENDFAHGCDFKGRCTCLAVDPKHPGKSHSIKLDILRWLPFTGTIYVIVIYLLLKVGCCCWCGDSTITWDCCEPCPMWCQGVYCTFHMQHSALILGICANTWKNCKLKAGIGFAKLSFHRAECDVLHKLQHSVKFLIFVKLPFLK